MVPVGGQRLVLLQRLPSEAPRGTGVPMSPVLRFTPSCGWHCLFKGKFQRKQIKSE